LGFSLSPSIGATGGLAGGARLGSIGHGLGARAAHIPRRRALQGPCMKSKNEELSEMRGEGGEDRYDEGRRLVSSMVPMALLAVGFPGVGEAADEPPIDKVAGLLKKQCAPYIAAVQASGGRLLYRGAAPPGDPQAPVNEPSDLLEDKTYGEVGAAYFANVEIWVGEKSEKGPLPSEGHVAVANVEEASKWGEPHSVWPIGAPKYLWLAESRLLYTDQWPEAEAKRWPMATTKMDAFLREKGVKVNTGLEEALAKGHEVLFVSQGYYLLPAAWEERLQEVLQLSGAPKST